MNKLFFMAQMLFILTLGFFTSKITVAEPANLGIVKQETRLYHDSGVYQKEFAQVTAQARAFIHQRVQHHRSSEQLALVLDIDETCLSNFDKMNQYDFGYNALRAHQDNLLATTPSLKSMLALYKEAIKQHINVFFITGRPASEAGATEKNLIAAGYTTWKKIYFKPQNYSQKSIAPFKTQIRQKIAQQGYTIIASIGDQNSDLQGGFAEKTFKLPNPYYFIA